MNLKITKIGSGFKNRSVGNYGKKENLFNYFDSFSYSMPITYYETPSTKNFNKLPKKEEGIFIMTSKKTQSYFLIEQINEKHKIKNISASFSSIDDKAINILNKYKVKNLITNGKNKTQYEKLKYQNYFNRPSHLRNYFIECENDVFISIITSTNPKVSSNNESYFIFNSKKVFDFYLKLFSNKTQNKKVEIIIPKNNDIVNIISINQFSPVDVLKKISKEEKIIEISFLQHGAGKKSILDLEKLIKNTKTNFFISSLTEKMIQSTFNQIKLFEKKYDVFVGVFSTHSKIILIETNKNFYSLISTANYNSIKKLENTLILNNKTIYQNILNFGKKYFK